MKSNRTLAISFLLLTLAIASLVAHPVDAQTNQAGVSVRRNVPINVNVIFVGLDPRDVQEQYLTWNDPQVRYPLVEIPGISTDTTYSITYTYSYAKPSFVQDFTSYLNSIAITETRTNVLWNESYFQVQGSYFLNYTHFPLNATNTYYSADKVESWLLGNAQEYGGLPSPGYTLMVADMSKSLPSVTPQQFQSLNTKHTSMLTPHFYKKTYTDDDLGVVLNRHFMTAWGGHSRFFFMDLSAGPGSAAEQYPIQLSSLLNQVTPTSPYWSSWVTQYLGDYITGAVYDIFVSD